jgi:hypothetical protein
MMLCSFAHSALRRVAFENVNLREASFLETRLTSVSFSGCDLTGADFRGARLKECTIRGSSLDGVVGVESLRGLTMPWVDLVGSVEALAAALGIEVEGERSETRRRSVDHRPRSSVDRQSSVADHRPRLARGPAQKRSHPREQLGVDERRADHVIDAGLERTQRVGGVGACTHPQDADTGARELALAHGS